MSCSPLTNPEDKIPSISPVKTSFVVFIAAISTIALVGSILGFLSMRGHIQEFKTIADVLGNKGIYLTMGLSGAFCLGSCFLIAKDVKAAFLAYITKRFIEKNTEPEKLSEYILTTLPEQYAMFAGPQITANTSYVFLILRHANERLSYFVFQKFEEADDFIDQKLPEYENSKKLLDRWISAINTACRDSSPYAGICEYNEKARYVIFKKGKNEPASFNKFTTEYFEELKRQNCKQVFLPEEEKL